VRAHHLPKPTEAIVYYSGTIAVHVDLRTRTVARVVQLREEIHLLADPPTILREGVLVECDQETANAVIHVADTAPWVGEWEFGY
jgi:hypothetical protein